MATPEVHSILGASAADRWMNCTPSARLTESMEDEESVFAAEGTNGRDNIRLLWFYLGFS